LEESELSCEEVVEKRKARGREEVNGTKIERNRKREREREREREWVSE